MGQLIGSTIAIVVLSLLWRLLLRKFLQSYKLVAGSIGAAFVTAVVLYAFGSADGGEPKWTAGILPYGIGSIIVLGMWIWRIRSTGTDIDG
jgi:hypothetical protein